MKKKIFAGLYITIICFKYKLDSKIAYFQHWNDSWKIGLQKILFYWLGFYRHEMMTGEKKDKNPMAK